MNRLVMNLIVRMIALLNSKTKRRLGFLFYSMMSWPFFLLTENSSKGGYTDVSSFVVIFNFLSSTDIIFLYKFISRSIQKLALRLLESYRKNSPEPVDLLFFFFKSHFLKPLSDSTACFLFCLKNAKQTQISAGVHLTELGMFRERFYVLLKLVYLYQMIGDGLRTLNLK
ncbi:hypothetical protein K501DRAFT_267688 [Backusella circina FSU 941]|nr:hypothetical protein K501DRAFT_267688 [Backusella circina FSU 941]